MFKLSEKYIDFIKDLGTRADFLEGTTASGKTTIGAGVKYMLKVSASEKKLHIIAGRTTGVVEKNILQQDNGILDLHKKAKYFGNGDKDYKFPHVKFEDKIILIMGYDNKDKWENALGGQYGCVFIDEINTADIEFIREISTRNEYLIATLNPDDPSLPVYKEFINRSRPFEKYSDDIPYEIKKELIETPVPNWRYWFFTFNDNLGLTQEDIERKISSAPKGTKLYKNKIIGLRGRATGLVFSNFERSEHIKIAAWAKKFLSGDEQFVIFTSGLDTAYSQKSPDTIAMTFHGITNKGLCIQLDERVYNNAELKTPLAPSDTVKNYIEFLNRNKDEWGLARNVFVDNADQATITELNKYKRQSGCIYIFNAAWKQTKIIDRINLQLGWLAKDKYIILDHCVHSIAEMETYSWQEDKDNTPEDSNDHTINSAQYSWLPYKNKIGGE